MRSGLPGGLGSIATGQTQSGPSGLWSMVFVPIGGPRTRLPVSTTMLPPDTSSAKRSRPRGAGPPTFSPTLLYFEPWQGHSNHCELWHHGTRQPRCTHFWYSATNPASMPAMTGGVYAETFLALG